MIAEATVKAADLFCGAGGSSTGLVRAARKMGRPLDLLAVNHWRVAVKTHTANHPWARHLCADLASVDPSRAIPGGRLDILIASPECTHFSIARGGKPRSDQSRASAWHVLHWAERLNIRRILLENVREFESWGPLTKRGKPDKRRKGQTFKAFVQALRSMGYSVEHRVLNAADFGDATTRHRLFLQAWKEGRPQWPAPSHAGQHRPAREVIDWSIQGRSIFKRKRPLAPRTLARIEAGLKKFGGAAFLAILRNHGSAATVDGPMPALCASGQHVGLCEPFIVEMEHQGGIRSTGRPLPTITTARGGSFGLVQPFVLGQQSCSAPRAVSDPMPTISTAGAIALVEPFVTKYSGAARGGKSVEQPLDTVTAKARFGLVEPDTATMDIRFRMLQPHELARAMGFDDYEFAGTKADQVRQIGNAVSVRTAEALCTILLS